MHEHAQIDADLIDLMECCTVVLCTVVLCTVVLFESSAFSHLMLMSEQTVSLSYVGTASRRSQGTYCTLEVERTLSNIHPPTVQHRKFDFSAARISRSGSG